MQISAGDKLVILTLGGVDYIQKVVNTTGPFLLFPGPNVVSPSISLWEATANTSCTTDASQKIRDTYNTEFPSLVGVRPPNIVKR